MLVRPLVALLVVLFLLVGCRITPEQIRLIEVENELLRHEIQVVKDKCEYYQEVDVQPEDDAE